MRGRSDAVSVRGQLVSCEQEVGAASPPARNDSARCFAEPGLPGAGVGEPGPDGQPFFREERPTERSPAAMEPTGELGVGVFRCRPARRVEQGLEHSGTEARTRKR